VKEEKYQRLRHWWQTFQQSLQNDSEESLRRKLYLLEAEIRKTLRDEPSSRARRRFHPALSFGITVGVLLLILGLLYLPFLHAPSSSQSAPSFQATLVRPVMSVKGTTSLSDAGIMEVRDSSAAKTSLRLQHRRPAKEHQISSPPPRTPTAPPPIITADTSPSPAPASVEAPASASPSTPPRISLDPLELLVALEGELEK